MTIRLIATDLDGTLLAPDGTVTPRTRRALEAARAAGMVTVPVTARQPHGLRMIAEQAGFTGWALCSNASLCLHLQTGEVLFETALPSEVQQNLVRELLARLPDVVCASIRQAGTQFVAQEGYAALSSEIDHKRDPRTMGGVPLEEVLAQPSLKLVLRHPELSPSELLREIRALGHSGFEATHSHAPFVEVMAQGSTKATGLAQLCKHLGIVPQEVMAFGDAPNDTEMLQWAGVGVAMGNADDALKAQANRVTTSNAADGVAVVIEQLLMSGANLP